METNTNKAVEFNNQWVRVISGLHEHPYGWSIRFDKHTRNWSVRRGRCGGYALPQSFEDKPFRKVDDAKRAVNQFMKDHNYTIQKGD